MAPRAELDLRQSQLGLVKAVDLAPNDVDTIDRDPVPRRRRDCDGRARRRVDLDERLEVVDADRPRR